MIENQIYKDKKEKKSTSTTIQEANRTEKKKYRKTKNQNTEPFICKLWLIFIDVILEQITAFSLTLTALPPIIFKRRRGVLITEVLILEVLKVVKS